MLADFLPTVPLAYSNELSIFLKAPETYKKTVKRK